MGFFSELKEDLSQAVNELVPEEAEAVAAEPVVEEAPISEEDIFAAAEASVGIEHSSDVTDMIAASEEMDKAMDEFRSELDSTPARVITPPEPKEEPKVEADFVSDEVATITRMMTVNGDLNSNGSLDIIGAVNGNINVKGKLNVTGSIVGNSQAAEIYAQDATIAGDVTSTGSVKVGSNTVIRGNIYATSAVIAGAVKGDIDVHGPVILDATAIVMGDIKSKAVQINNGAAIEGRCSQCYADVSPSNFFKD
ncbi:MAG: polymer-forming cytoskeletal protein [Lachnospiraceae bacterium]|nr:polymer-forming cytoskeletal protein [Lachnospiraceae bacterium]